MFTHLHLHTEYSLLDGLARIPQLMERARELGQEAIGLTDHGALYGAVSFYKEARARGLKPIIGVEAYQAQGSRLSREPADKQPFHLTLLARDQAGYRNLLALVTKAHQEGYYYRPRMDKELLQEHHQGIIALSGCYSGEVPRLLAADRWDEAVQAARWYKEVFGDFYVELQEHNIPEAATLIKKLVRLASELDLPLVATNDVHFVRREDAPIHDILLCIGTNTSILDERRMRLAGDADSYCLKSEEEMRQLFPALPQAIDNTWRIAEMCDLELEFGRPHLPEADVPPGLSADDYLAQLCHEGLARLYPSTSSGQVPSAAHRELAERRLEYELSVVRQTGFAHYILVVHDLAQFARRQGILMAVRGSAAASIILYCLGVTDIDPLEYRLVFERFLNVERREMPDVDLDFAEDRRDEVIRYAAEKYGHDRVAQIITFGTMGAKAAIRDVGRALGMTYADVDRVARLVPAALHMSIDRALGENAELRSIYEADDQVKRLVDTAKQVEGVARHASTHAAGVVIGPEPLVNFLPLQRPARGDATSIPTTQYAMEAVADIGLLKMDFLGLVNLTILGKAVDIIRETRGVDIDLKTLPDRDAKTYALLSTGETFGVFQLESAGMRRYVQELKPTAVHDLAAMVALYRPGPMQHIPTYIRAKHGLEETRYPHPDLADILDETYGVIVYQDQVLLIAQKFADYALGEADVMRRAMGKKIAAVMRAERERFLAGAKTKGYRQAQAEQIFNLIEPFAGYAFNKAHAVSYARIAYQTAYLKANFPAEYMTAVLMLAEHHPAGAAQRVAEATAECARLGISVLPPDVNHSAVKFSLERLPTGQAGLDDGGEGIRFGLANIKNVGAGIVEGIIAARNEGGPFASIEDFCQRVSFRQLNKRALECMIKAGALDSLGGRGTLLANLDRLMNLAQSAQKLRESGQATLFDIFQETAPSPALALQEAEVPRAQQLAWEKELLGVYVSEHPFTRAAAALGPQVTAMCSEVSEEMNGREVIIAGIVAHIRQILTRAGRPFLAVEMEDLTGSVEVTVWPDVYDQTRDLWAEGSILLLTVRVRSRNDRLQVSVQKAIPYEEGSDPEPAGGFNGPLAAPRPVRASRSPVPRGRDNGPREMRITLRETEDPDSDHERLRAVMSALQEFEGDDHVRLTIRQQDGDEVELELPRARACEELGQRLSGLLGDAGAVVL